jgi:integrase
MRKPYYVQRLKCWYVKDSASNPIRLDPNKKKAFELWHELQSASCFKGARATVRGLLEEFFNSIEGTVSQERFDRLVRYSQLFIDDHGSKLITEITPAVLAKWLDDPKPGRRHKGLKDDEEPKPIYWGSSSKRHATALLKRAWSWARNQGHIQVNAIAQFALPECDYREEVIDPSIHNKLVEHCMSNPEARPFALYLIASRCGVRPQQIREVTAANVSPCRTMWIFKRHKTAKKTGKPLVVYLSPCLQSLTRILVATHPTGPLFRNVYGKPWKSDTVSQRMERLRKRLDLPPGTVAYLYRHTLATDALVAGHSTAIVAKLLGHTDTRMVSKVYGHLEKQPQFMLEASRSVSQSRLKPMG